VAARGRMEAEGARARADALLVAMAWLEWRAVSRAAAAGKKEQTQGAGISPNGLSLQMALRMVGSGERRAREDAFL